MVWMEEPILWIFTRITSMIKENTPKEFPFPFSIKVNTRLFFLSFLYVFAGTVDIINNFIFLGP